MSEHGSTGELRLTGAGKVNLNGTLHMDFCGGCVTDPAGLAKRSSKVSIIGSGGTFNVGLDPDPMVVDPIAAAARPPGSFDDGHAFVHGRCRRRYARLRSRKTLLRNHLVLRTLAARI